MAEGDERFWAAVKGQFVVPPEVAVMNAANLCPAPFTVLEATSNQRDLDHDLSTPNRERMHAGKEATRRLLGEVLRVSPDDLLITRNTSESNNQVSNGLDLRAGDEVVLFADNHPSNLEAWQKKGKRFGYTVKVVPVTSPHPGPEAVIRAFEAAMTPRTRVIGFSHLTSTVGDLLPAKALCRLARERGVLSLVDGAQSFGLMDIDLSDLQPDFYSGSAHKWPCGPKETGVLYVSKAAQGRFWPSVISAYVGESGLAKTCEGWGSGTSPPFSGLPRRCASNRASAAPSSRSGPVSWPARSIEGLRLHGRRPALDLHRSRALARGGVLPGGKPRPREAPGRPLREGRHRLRHPHRERPPGHPPLASPL